VDDWLNEYRRYWAGKLGRLKRYAESQKPERKKGERK
jgi:hypothetical protein